VAITGQGITAGADDELILQIPFLQHLQTGVSRSDRKQIAQHTGPEIAVNPFTASRQQGSSDLLPGGNEQWLPGISTMDEAIPDLWVLLMLTPQQHQWLTKIQPAFQRSQATGGRIDPDTALSLQHSDAEHIGLHCRQTNIAKSLFKG
tara:strand:+ start:1239 stop:1682 length:444 start_codon:yes stop_codon:yes gene_type:complete